MSKVKTDPVRGTRDFLPEQAALRDWVKETLKHHYRLSGFTLIETPSLENMVQLQSGEGGDNEKMLFKILHRGEKLDLGKVDLTEIDLVDCGLRFDLTVPLTRFVAQHYAKLPMPFKSIQIGDVYRAERPQKGRYRQFLQCDIDYIGGDEGLAELDLITTSAQALEALGITGFTVRLNDRRLLTAMTLYAGIEVCDHDTTFIALDKLDKIGLTGVQAELNQRLGNQEAVIKLIDLLADQEKLNDLPQFLKPLHPYLEAAVGERLVDFISSLKHLSENRFNVIFDPTLVRGMGYYTGAIFEVSYKDYPFSIAGGGRYDNMVGRWFGREVPACGFSIGFERLCLILEEEGKKSPAFHKKVAVIIAGEQDATLGIQKAQQERADGHQAVVVIRKKKFKKQLDTLIEQGYQFALIAQQTEHSEQLLWEEKQLL